MEYTNDKFKINDKEHDLLNRSIKSTRFENRLFVGILGVLITIIIFLLASLVNYQKLAYTANTSRYDYNHAIDNKLLNIANNLYTLNKSLYKVDSSISNISSLVTNDSIVNNNKDIIFNHLQNITVTNVNKNTKNIVIIKHNISTIKTDISNIKYKLQ